jgi:hypothetical protein
MRTVGLTGVVLLAMLVLAQAGSASTVTRVEPNEACPGEEVTIIGTGFQANNNQVQWHDDKTRQQGTWGGVNTNGLFVSATEMRAIVPLFIQL